MVTGLEPCDSSKCSLECPHIVFFVKMCTLTQYDLYVLRQMSVSDFYLPLSLSLCVHYHHYPSLRIVIEYPQLLLHTFSKLYWTFSIHVILLPIKAGDSLCVLQSTSYSFASTISTCCSAWAWDHECHITVYDLSR